MIVIRLLKNTRSGRHCLCFSRSCLPTSWCEWYAACVSIHPPTWCTRASEGFRSIVYRDLFSWTAFRLCCIQSLRHQVLTQYKCRWPFLKNQVPVQPQLPLQPGQGGSWTAFFLLLHLWEPIFHQCSICWWCLHFLHQHSSHQNNWTCQWGLAVHGWKAKPPKRYFHRHCSGNWWVTWHKLPVQIWRDAGLWNLPSS